jgi:hypothetical protein
MKVTNQNYGSRVTSQKTEILTYTDVRASKLAKLDYKDEDDKRQELILTEYDAPLAGNGNLLFDATYCHHVPRGEISKTLPTLTQLRIPEGQNPRLHRCGNLKPDNLPDG